MRCHYAVLGLDFDAKDDEIKKIYRKAALRLHPDKNIGREAEAAEEFKELQAAYSTLSDPQERAFYDRNRESIINANSGGNSSDSHVPDLFGYFSRSCFPGGFTDDKNGFYTVYGQIFRTIYEMDCKYTKVKKEVPDFGISTSDSEDVADFYGYWTSYCTAASFAWCDQRNINDRINRYTEKLINKENKVFRDAEKNKFNEKVRELAYFCRRRDPRWKKRVAEFERKNAEAAEKRRENEKKEAERRKKEFQEAMDNELLKKEKDEYLQRLEEMENLMREEGEIISDDDSFLEFEYFCEPCSLLFESESELTVHKRSKEHQEELLIRDHQSLIEENDWVENLQEEESDVVENESDEDTHKKRKDRKKRKQQRKNDKRKKNQNPTEYEEEDEDVEKEESGDISEQVEEVTELVEDMKVGEKEETPAEVKPKLKGKKAKEARKKAREEKERAAAQLNGEEEEEEGDSISCQTCKAKFPSKNKLFQHLKSSGHASLKSASTEKKRGKKKKK